MGDVIWLGDRGRENGHATTRRHRPRVSFWFDLACPYSYLAAGRVEHLLPTATWRPALTEALHSGDPVADPAAREALRISAERRAAELGTPLVWPRRHPAPVRAAMRVASLASAEGRGSDFALAASRLAFCGGFDLEEPEVLAEAAAAAGIGLEDCLRAAGDVSRDAGAEDAGRRLLAAGADRLPVVGVGRSLFCGEHRLPDAARAAAAAGRVSRTA
jgi:2-hydroxychromene-2-carboxylate isomerase